MKIKTAIHDHLLDIALRVTGITPDENWKRGDIASSRALTRDKYAEIVDEYWHVNQYPSRKLVVEVRYLPVTDAQILTIEAEIFAWMDEQTRLMGEVVQVAIDKMARWDVPAVKLEAPGRWAEFLWRLSEFKGLKCARDSAFGQGRVLSEDKYGRFQPLEWEAEK